MNRFCRGHYIALTAIIILLAVVSCEHSSPFAEYAGVDILTSRDLSLADAVDDYLLDATPAHDYVTLTPLTAAEYGPVNNGLPDGAAVYRLELPNLLPDGDFEAATVGSGGNFTEVGPPGRFEVANAGDMPQGNYLAFDVASGTWGEIDLTDSAGVGLADGLVANATYHIEFDVRRRDDSTAVVFDYASADGGSEESYLNTQGLTWTFQEESGVSGTPLETFPGTGVFNRPATFVGSAQSENFFYVGSIRNDTPVGAGFVDNIRIGRYDVRPHAAFNLSAVADTGLDLVPGRYEFSVYVKAEIDAQVTPASGNRFRTSRISLGANDQLVSFEASEEEWDSETWVLLSATVELTDAELANPIALRLQLFPGSTQNPEVGSILIAAPSLTLQL